MSYESLAIRRGLSEISRLKDLVRKGTATSYQKKQLFKLLKEYGHHRKETVRPK